MGSLYSEQRTWLHEFSAGLKLLCLAILGSGLFLTSHLLVLGLATGASCALFLSLGAARQPVNKLMKMVLLSVLLVALFHILLGQTAQGLLSACRLFSASLLGISLTLTTHSHDLQQVFERLLQPLRHFGLQPQRTALQFALMLRFAEHFFVQWKRLDEAHRVRCGRAGGLRILTPLLIQMLLSARRVADALQTRWTER